MSWPDQMRQQHVFRFDADQSYLPAVISQCRKLLGRSPIRGRRESRCLTWR